MDNKTLTRTVIAGGVLSGLGIALFFLLWFGLGSAQVAQLPRVVLSVCLPPAIMAMVVGLYFIIARGSTQPPPPDQDN